MTTAHRPTFDPAKGKEATRGPAYHQRLLPAHTHLKQRKAGQGGIGGLSSSADSTAQRYGAPAPQERDLRQELLQAEAAVRARKNGGVDPEADTSSVNGNGKRKSITDDNEEEDPEVKRRRLILEEAHDVDADTDDEDKASTDASSDSEADDDDDSEDEEATLLAELAKIKAERAAVRAAEDAAKAAKEAEAREVEIARGNPLLNDGAALEEKRDFGVKRRWDDDVVFRNQGRGTEVARGSKGEFVNDLLRSDFHKRFMSKYVR